MVYVDDMAQQHGRYTLCHMVADTHAELLRMLEKLRVRRRWIQQPGTYREHYDLSWPKRRDALERFGAVEVTQRQLAEIVRARRSSAGMARYYESWVVDDDWACAPGGPKHVEGD